METYEEKVETSTVTYKIAICPDSECQKVVDKKLKDEEKKRAFIKGEQEKRELQRKMVLAERKHAHLTS